MILLYIVLFVIGVCISFSGVFIIAKNTDIGLDLFGKKDYYVELTDFGWMVSILLIIVGGGMIYFSYNELAPYIIGTFELK